MMGLGVLLFLLIWAGLSLLIANLIGKKLLKRFTKDDEGRTTSKGILLILLMSVLVFFTPIVDEIISYPRYAQMCQDVGKYEFGPGMNAKKVFGRHFYVKPETQVIRLFPKIQTLQSDDDWHKGVVVKSTKLELIDVNTEELLLTSKDVLPISSFFALRWDNSKIPWLLQQCTANNYDYLRSLQLKQVYR